MDHSLPHPTTLSMSQDELRNDYIKISTTQLPDAHWHFETAMHKSTRLGPPGKVPTQGTDVQRLAIFNRADPLCDLEFFGTHLVYDINPADWLDLWLEQQKHVTIVSRKRFPYVGGAIGDVLARWDVEGVPWVGRFFVTKVGPRVFLLWSRVKESDYARMAEPIFLAIMSFRALDTSAGPLAEGIRWVNGKTPTPWKLALPASWHGEVQPGNDQAAAFQATLLNQGPDGVPQILAKLSFAILAPPVVKDGPDLGEKTLVSVRSAGVAFESTQFVEEPATEPYTAAWYLETTGNLNGTPVAIHARILQHPNAWVSAIMVGAAREVNPLLWMQARRMLDIVTMTLVIE